MGVGKKRQRRNRSVDPLRKTQDQRSHNQNRTTDGGRQKGREQGAAAAYATLQESGQTARQGDAAEELASKLRQETFPGTGRLEQENWSWRSKWTGGARGGHYVYAWHVAFLLPFPLPFLAPISSFPTSLGTAWCWYAWTFCRVLSCPVVSLIPAYRLVRLGRLSRGNLVLPGQGRWDWTNVRIV